MGGRGRSLSVRPAWSIELARPAKAIQRRPVSKNQEREQEEEEEEEKDKEEEEEERNKKKEKQKQLNCIEYFSQIGLARLTQKPKQSKPS